MGQRHQLFAAAKINGRYRSLAAIHHQWLYGLTVRSHSSHVSKSFFTKLELTPKQALQRCTDLLKIARDPANSPLLQADLSCCGHQK